MKKPARRTPEQRTAARIARTTNENNRRAEVVRKREERKARLLEMEGEQQSATPSTAVKRVLDAGDAYFGITR